jgi:PAS domain S-box-containing protein
VLNPGPNPGGPRRLASLVLGGLAAVVLLIVVNVAALVLGWPHPWIVIPTIVLDAIVLASIFGIAWRRAHDAEEALARRTAEQRQETAKVQAALADTEARYAAILDSAMDAVITVDETQRILVFNRAAELVFGCSRREVLGDSLARFIPMRFREGHGAHIARFGTTGTTNRRMGDATVLRAQRSDGSEFPIEASISQTEADGRHLFTVILRDVTRRKEAEDALLKSQRELRELSAQVLQTREEEKTHIARELHDELGQALTALKMDLAWLRQNLPPGDEALSAKAATMNATLDATVASTRRISADLRPLILDDLGLADAAEWLVDEYSQRSGIECRLDMDDPDGLASLPAPVATALYRILQESLTNIARHAGATQVHIALQQHAAEVSLEVQDNGRGITEEDRAKPTSFGLRGIRERADYLGGHASIGTAPEGGTRLSVSIPLHNGPES